MTEGSVCLTVPATGQRMGEGPGRQADSSDRPGRVAAWLLGPGGQCQARVVRPGQVAQGAGPGEHSSGQVEAAAWWAWAGVSGPFWMSRRNLPGPEMWVYWQGMPLWEGGYKDDQKEMCSTSQKAGG